MRDIVRERLVGLGCKSVPALRVPKSFGAGILRIKRLKRYLAALDATKALRRERGIDPIASAATQGTTSPGR